jgi:hypothetical protein
MALMGGAGAGAAAAPEPPLEKKSPSQVIEEMLSLADLYRSVEKDHEDLLAMEQASTLLRKILAMQQKQQDSAFGNPGTVRMLRRT